jgi:hypothetical protein
MGSFGLALCAFAEAASKSQSGKRTIQRIAPRPANLMADTTYTFAVAALDRLDRDARKRNRRRTATTAGDAPFRSQRVGQTRGDAHTRTFLDMHWILLAGFIAAHVLAYIAVFRHLKVFAAERTIAIYHGLAFAAVFAFARGTIGFAASCGLLALQYVYSLSFLELWTLAEGSYSLQILLRVSRQASISREEILASCEAIGADKKRNRLHDLQSLRLIAEDPDGTVKISAMGRMLVDTLSLIMRLTTIREAG